MKRVILLLMLSTVMIIANSFSAVQDSCWESGFFNSKYKLPLESVDSANFTVKTSQYKNIVKIVSTFKADNYIIRYEMYFDTKKPPYKLVNFQNFIKAKLFVNNSKDLLNNVEFNPTDIFNTGWFLSPVYLCRTSKTVYLISGGRTYGMNGHNACSPEYFIVDLKNLEVFQQQRYSCDFEETFKFPAFDINNDGVLEILELEYVKDIEANNYDKWEAKYVLYDMANKKKNENCYLKYRVSVMEHGFEYDFIEVKDECLK